MILWKPDCRWNDNFNFLRWNLCILSHTKGNLQWKISEKMWILYHICYTLPRTFSEYEWDFLSWGCTHNGLHFVQLPNFSFMAVKNSTETYLEMRMNLIYECEKVKVFCCSNWIGIFSLMVRIFFSCVPVFIITSVNKYSSNGFIKNVWEQFFIQIHSWKRIMEKCNIQRENVWSWRSKKGLFQ